jgi:hypothetical protein
MTLLLNSVRADLFSRKARKDWIHQCCDLSAFTCKISSMEFTWSNIHRIGLIVVMNGLEYQERSHFQEKAIFLRSVTVSRNMMIV